MIELFGSALVTFLVIIDPPGCAPIFVGLTRGASPAQRRAMAIRSSLIAWVILMFFALLGRPMLHWLGISLASFRIAGGSLEFVNLAEQHGLGPAPEHYSVSWARYDDATGAFTALGHPQNAKEPRFAWPADAWSGSGESYLVAEIRSHHPDRPSWERAVRVYIRASASGNAVVGIERESSGLVGHTRFDEPYR